MKLNFYSFFLFSLICLFAGSISIFSQAPFNFLPILFFSFPIFFHVIKGIGSENSFFKRLFRFIYFGSIFLYGYFFFGLFWISSAFNYREEFEGLKLLSIFGLPLLLVFFIKPWLDYHSIFLGAKATKLFCHSPRCNSWRIL